jgi:hypothetical protein
MVETFTLIRIDIEMDIQNKLQYIVILADLPRILETFGIMLYCTANRLHVKPTINLFTRGSSMVLGERSILDYSAPNRSNYPKST